MKNMKERLSKGASKYQIGSIPNHCYEEHLVSLKTILAKAEEANEGIMFLSDDLISFFDREGLQDCVDSLKEINVNNKAIRIWYQMNSDTIIKIKTHVGDTKERFVGDCVAQGTISAALVSANNLDRGHVKNFKDCENTVKYGNINILPLAYQDDIGDMVTNVMMIKEYAKRIDNLLA